MIVSGRFPIAPIPRNVNDMLNLGLRNDEFVRNWLWRMGFARSEDDICGWRSGGQVFNLMPLFD
jgi:hypothetical protein